MYYIEFQKGSAPILAVARSLEELSTMPEHWKVWSHVNEGPEDLNERLNLFVIPPGKSTR